MRFGSWVIASALLLHTGRATSVDAPRTERYAVFASLSEGSTDHAGHAHAEPHHADTHYVSPAHTADAHRSHAHAHGPARAMLRTNFGSGWSHEWIHAHASPKDTPYVHGFFVEPAFLGREVFLSASGTDGETVIDAEVEWSLTRRLALIGELSYVDLDDESGIGDGAIALRALMIETEEFLLSASGEIELPIGDESRGLGSGSAAAGLFMHTWIDMGNWFTLQTQTGIEHVFEEAETAFVWRAMLAKSFPATPLLKRPCGLGEHELDTWSLFVELDAETPFDGDLEGSWLVGATYPLVRGYNLRAGYTRTFDGVDGWTIGLVLHP